MSDATSWLQWLEENGQFWDKHTLEEARAYHEMLEAQAAAMREALSGVMRWEALLINSNAAWPESLPRFTQELYDAWMALQAKRNEALASDAGKALLERLHRAEDLADGDMVEARLAQMRQRAEKAEAKFHEWISAAPIVRERDEALERLGKAETEAIEWKRNALVVEKAANAWTDDARRMEAERDEARDVLRELEWVSFETGTGRRCPKCRGFPQPHGIGHAEDCRLAKVLGYDAQVIRD